MSIFPAIKAGIKSLYRHYIVSILIKMPNSRAAAKRLHCLIHTAAHTPLWYIHTGHLYIGEYILKSIIDDIAVFYFVFAFDYRNDHQYQ